MVNKRPFDEHESIEVSPKQPRQLEPDSRLFSALEHPCNHPVQSPHASGEVDNHSAKITPACNEKLNLSYAEPQFSPKKDIADIASTSVPCSSWATATGTVEEDNKLEEPFDYYHTERRPPRTNVNHGEIYSFLFDHPPRKLVPIGPDFQANIPEFVHAELSDCKKELAGTCVIPLQDLTANQEIGVGRIDCSCVDVGSTRCIRQHILEASEKLKTMLGDMTFSQLGFCDMGEMVAKNWSEEEQQLFHEVVFSNPASLGKNFWDQLVVAFPSRTKREFVSYYFNVFMLRKRAEQNRFDSMNVDSDNDEWQGTENCSDSEVEVGSPGKIDKSCHETGVVDNQDDAQNGHEFLFEACNAREWDVGYLTRPRNEMDLLPTCSMIEEIFGAGSWK